MAGLARQSNLSPTLKWLHSLASRPINTRTKPATTAIEPSSIRNTPNMAPNRLVLMPAPTSSPTSPMPMRLRPTILVLVMPAALCCWAGARDAALRARRLVTRLATSGRAQGASRRWPSGFFGGCNFGAGRGAGAAGRGLAVGSSESAVAARAAGTGTEGAGRSTARYAADGRN